MRLETEKLLASSVALSVVFFEIRYNTVLFRISGILSLGNALMFISVGSWSAAATLIKENMGRLITKHNASRTFGCHPFMSHKGFTVTFGKESISVFYIMLEQLLPKLSECHYLHRADKVATNLLWHL